MKRKIAFIGKSGSGKDYVTEQLIHCLEQSGENSCRFAFADKIKIQIGELFNFTEEQQQKVLHDEIFKNHTLLNITKLEIVAESDIEHKDKRWKEVKTADQYDAFLYSGGQEYEVLDNLDVYMSLREFIVYYGTYYFQKNFGRKIWVRTLFNSNLFKKMEDEGVVIITDVRFPHEYEMCKEKGFVFVKVQEKTATTKKREDLGNVAEFYTDTFPYDFCFSNYKDDVYAFNLELRRFLFWVNYPENEKLSEKNLVN